MMKIPKYPSDEEIIIHAINQYELQSDGTIEIIDNLPNAQNDITHEGTGCWVKAKCWIRYDSIKGFEHEDYI